MRSQSPNFGFLDRLESGWLASGSIQCVSGNEACEIRVYLTDFRSSSANQCIVTLCLENAYEPLAVHYIGASFSIRSSLRCHEKADEHIDLPLFHCMRCKAMHRDFASIKQLPRVTSDFAAASFVTALFANVAVRVRPMALQGR